MSPPCSTAGDSGGAAEIMLFGVRVKVAPMRKSVSMNNLSQYQQPHDSSSNVDAAAGGYASADDAVVHHQSSTNRERKRGVPWTEEEHKLFLLGLQRVGKGDWRGISRNFVKTRTPTQVASHAQKYFLRRSNLNRRRRRSSLFDITTDSVTAVPMEEGKVPQDNTSQPLLPTTPLPQPGNINISGFPGSVAMEIDQVNKAATKLVHPIPVLPSPTASPTRALNLNQGLMIDPLPLSLKLSLSSDDQNELFRHSAFQLMSSFSNGDSSISVA